MTAEAVASAEAPLRLQAGGTLNPRRHLYIERPDDAVLLRLLSEGQYVNVLTSRQMGKSSLMVRTAQTLTDRGARCAIVDLAAELGSPQDASAYFLGLLNKIARDLKIKADLPTWWAERSGETPNQRLIRFFREVVLEQVPGTVVCFLDEIDSTLKLPWTDDLFTALRGMHNERALVPAYERLTFCLLGVASPNELIKDRRTTPYNVGSTLELQDFYLGRDDLRPLIASLAADPEQGRRLVERVLHWTGGQPYLTLRLCASLAEIGAKTPDDVDRRVDESFRSLERVSGDVHFQQVLRFLETRLADGLATFSLYEQILRGARERDQPTLTHTELKLSSLVKRDEEGCLIVRNRIYKRLFDRRWLENIKPNSTLRIYRRWARVAAAAFLIGALAAGGWIASLQMRLNERQRLEALNDFIISTEGPEGMRILFAGGTSQAVLEEAAPLWNAVGRITDLDLGDTQVADLAPLVSFTNLQKLRLRRTPVADLAHLANLTSLKALDLGATQVADATPLANLINLQWLLLSDTQVADAAPLAGLSNLQKLYLDGTQITDAAPLADLSNLQELYLRNTQVTDLAPLANLTNLTQLDLADTPVADVTRLASLVNLKQLNLTGTQIRTLQRFQTSPKMEELYLARTQFADVATLASLSSLAVLDLENTMVDDIAGLADLTNLRWLDLTGTQVQRKQVTELKRALAEQGNHSIEIFGP